VSPRPLPFERDDQAAPGAAGARPVVTLTLEQPGKPLVILNRELLQRLEATLDAIGNEIGGLVIRSASDRVFVAGADLQEIDGLNDDDLDAYLAEGQRVLGRIAALPCATVAAVNGAALGGGLELAMHCDSIVALRPAEGARPYQLGLPEAGLGILPGWGGTNLLPARIEPGRAIGLTASGGSLKPDEAHKAGLADELADSPDALLAAARTRAAAPKRHAASTPRCVSDAGVRDAVGDALSRVRADLPDTPAARAVADAVAVGLDKGWQAALDAERELLIKLRRTPESKAAFKAFFERSAKR